MRHRLLTKKIDNNIQLWGANTFIHKCTNFSINDTLQFELKIFCPKLDEVAKDENVESGVEDTDEESKD